MNALEECLGRVFTAADELKELLREYDEQIKKLPSMKPLDMMGISEKVQLAKFILHCQGKTIQER